MANGGTLVSDLIAGHVSDADSGASAGIAVVGVDNTNGTWQYSLDAGASWSSFGAPSAASRPAARRRRVHLCALRSQRRAGTAAVANGLTFRAWDRTSGVSGGTADTTSATLSVRDEFTADSYANNDGTASWSTSWVDTDVNPAAGQIRVTGGELVLSTFLGSGSVYRQVDLSGAHGRATAPSRTTTSSACSVPSPSRYRATAALRTARLIRSRASPTRATGPIPRTSPRTSPSIRASASS